MIKKQGTQKSLKQRDAKARRIEIDKAIKALASLKNQSFQGRQVRTVVGDGTVVVRVISKGSNSLSRKGYGFDPSQNPKRNIADISSQFIDQSIIDTERAVRTLHSEPSKKVEDIYKNIASISAG